MPPFCLLASPEKTYRMKNSILQRILGLTTVAAVLVAIGAFAQQKQAPAPGLAPGDVRILKISDLGKDSLQKAKSLDGHASQKAKQWGVYDVSFATMPAWIDEMSATYTLILQKKPNEVEPGEKAISLFQTTVDYSDIQQGRDHKAGVVLYPAALLRFGTPIGFAVQLNVGNTEVASEHIEGGILKDKAKWWADPKIIDAPTVARRNGYLVDRMKSPFQLIDIDSYEVSR